MHKNCVLKFGWLTDQMETWPRFKVSSDRLENPGSNPTLVYDSSDKSTYGLHFLSLVLFIFCVCRMFPCDHYFFTSSAVCFTLVGICFNKSEVMG